MTQALTYQCPNCQGTLVFDGTSGQLVCDFCDSHFDPAAIEALYAERQAAADAKAQQPATAAAAERARTVTPATRPDEIITAPPSPVPDQVAQTSDAAAPVAPIAGDPIDVYLAHSHWEQLPEDQVAALNCTACGAQLLVEKTTAATTCPYCGNHSIVAGQLAGALKPDFVIPFKMDRQAALDALKGYYQGKRLLPNAFTQENHLEEIMGVYVPFWLYTGSADASLAMNGRILRTWMDSRNTYLETSHYRIDRAGTMNFHRVPVDASTKMPDGHMDAIEPFDYREMVPFSVGYLPGFITDRFDQDAQTCCTRAQNRIENTCAETLQRTVGGYTETDVISADARLNLQEVAYALLPVWMLHTRWQGHDYLFAMNGQTGKMVGDLPIDRGKCVKTFLLWFVPAMLVMLVLVYFVLGFGY